MSDYHNKFAELYQFFGGYFYQGWANDYNWETARPNFAAVVRHYKAVNPPLTVTKLKNELEDFLSLKIKDTEMSGILASLGNNFHAPAENLTYRQWLENILVVLNESPTEARVLRELK